MTMSPKAQAAVDADREKRRARARAGVPINPPSVPGARSFSLSEVGPGWRLHSTRRQFAGEEHPDLGEPVGGTCVEVVHRRRVDDDTGETWEETSYRCLATWRPGHPWQILAADEVDVARLAGVDREATTVAIRWLVDGIATSRQRWLTRDEQDRIADAYRLACVA